MASSSAAGTVKSLSESRAEALQALLDSLEPGAEANRGEKHNPDQVRKLSEKLGELLDEDTMLDMSQRNEKGELVNEEGLPIVDIVEAVPASASSCPPVETNMVIHDLDLIPLWALSPEEKARRRAERDRILDALEEEERIQQEKDKEEEREHFKAELEKRKQAAEVDMAAMKKAREMQRKMGKALIRNIAVAREQEEKEKLALEEADKQVRDERRKLKPKKSVTFADLPPDHDHQPANSASVRPPFDWGDVARATLRPGEKSSVLTKSQMDRGPIRMNVVERVPGRVLRGPKSPPPSAQKDSDDESEPGSPVRTDSDEAGIMFSDYSDSEDPPPPQSLNDSDESDYGGAEDTDPIEWDHDGIDFARHQCEVALEYYEKRATVGAEALAAMRNHEHAGDQHEWDQPVVPLEATLASSPPRLNVSRFKASRASTSTLPSQSLGASIIPASQSSTLKAAVRLGKLEDGKLIGGDEGESEDEMEPAAKDMLEMLKKGEVMNVGPRLSHNGGTALTLTPTTTELPDPSKAKPSRVSQLKMSIAGPSALHAPESPGSSVSTPITVMERFLPTLPSRSGTPIPIPKKHASLAGTSQTRCDSRPRQMPSMTVDSPSFPSHGMIASLSGTSTPPPQTAFDTLVIESPSFLSPSSIMVGTPEASSSLSPNVSSPSTPAASPLSASVFERRPRIMDTQVRESTTTNSRSAGSTSGKKKSKFLAERE